MNYNRSFLILNFCLALILVFIIPPVYSDDTQTNKEFSSWVLIDSYKIGSGDVLEILTWKEPDFSREGILVRIDGKISFPLLGDIQVAGQTPLQVKKKIEKRLEDFVDNPIVTVSVKAPGSQKFYVLGEVVNTGEYTLIKDLTVLQAFALAGGFTEWASKKEIILLRNENGKEKIIRVNYKKIIQGKDFSENIHIKANDTIIVP